MLTQKSNDFRPAYKNQVNFDHPHNSQANRSPHKNEVISGPHTKTKSILTPAQKTSQFRPPQK